MGLKCWFRDDLRDTLAGLTATVIAGDRELSDYDQGRLSMLASVATAFGLDPSELCAERLHTGPPGYLVGVEYAVRD